MNQESRKAGKNGRRKFLLSCFPDSYLLLLLPFLIVVGCKREERGFRIAPPAADTIQAKSMSDLAPAGASAPVSVTNGYEENAYATAEGQKLYVAMNCVGCHAHGGGGMAPALIDNKWIYGSEPHQIFATIVEGRPNGMPSFRGKIPDHQVWQIVAYVRSMSGLGTSGASPGRSDNMAGATPPSSMPAQTPQNSSLPKSAEMPPP